MIRPPAEPPAPRHVTLHSLIGLVVSQSSDAAAQRQQRRVDVVRLLHSLAVLLGFTALGSCQITHREPAGHRGQLHINSWNDSTAFSPIQQLHETPLMKRHGNDSLADSGHLSQLGLRLDMQDTDSKDTMARNVKKTHYYYYVLSSHEIEGLSGLNVSVF